MRNTIYLFFLICMSVLSKVCGQDSAFVFLQLEDAEGDYHFYDYNGLNFNAYAEPTLHNDSLNKVNISRTQFMYIGREADQKLPFILSPGDTVRIIGKAKSLRAANVRSAINQLYAKIENQKKDEAKEFGQLINRYRLYFRDESKLKSVVSEMAELDKKRLEYYEFLTDNHPFLAKFYAVDLYLSYQNHGGKYENEIEYFSNEYFSFVDLKDPMYSRIPHLYEASHKYIETLSNFIKNEQALLEIIHDTFASLPRPSKAHQICLAGLINFSKKEHYEIFLDLANEYIEYYSVLFPEDAANLQSEIAAFSHLVTGSLAPDITLKNTEGRKSSLNDLRGNIILLDFWASWCVPCRKETPNIRKAYEKYKDRGFDVMSVSLDKEKDKWIHAIKKDSMIWHNISDLKGWDSEVVTSYQLNAIPRTYLLDADGNIIAKNLRGDALHKKLDEIYSDIRP